MGVCAEAAGPLSERSTRPVPDPSGNPDSITEEPNGLPPDPSDGLPPQSPAGGPHEPPNRRRRWRQVVILAIAAVAAVIVLRGKLPTVGELVQAIRAALGRAGGEGPRGGEILPGRPAPPPRRGWLPAWPPSTSRWPCSPANSRRCFAGWAYPPASGPLSPSPTAGRPSRSACRPARR